jgi:glutamate:GABA antiporter
VIWIAAWLLFYTPLALSVIELSSRYPNEGGLYVWSKKAFGDFHGFMSAWTYWTCNLPYFPTVLIFAATQLVFIRRDAWLHLATNPTYIVIFSVLGLGAASLLNLFGLDIGKWLHNAGAVAMWVPALIIMVMGFIAWHRFGSATPFTRHSMVPGFHVNDLIVWYLLTFALSGCEAASFMGEEIKNARRTIPRALLTAGITVTVVYILGTFCVLLALPASEGSSLQGLMQAVSATARRIGFEGIIPVTALLIGLSNLGAAGAFLAAMARLPFVAGLDRFLPPIFGALHPRWRTPWFALITQFVFGLVFLVLGGAGTSVKGAYDVLVSMSVITYFIPFMYLFASMFKLQRETAGADVIRVPGGKPVARVIAVVGFLTTTLTIVLACIPQPDEPHKPLAVLKVVGLSGLTVLIGSWLYWAGKKRAARPM